MIEELSVKEGRHFLAYKLRFFMAMKEARVVAEKKQRIVAAVLFGVLIGIFAIAYRSETALNSGITIFGC